MRNFIELAHGTSSVKETSDKHGKRRITCQSQAKASKKGRTKSLLFTFQLFPYLILLFTSLRRVATSYLYLLLLRCIFEVLILVCLTIVCTFKTHSNKENAYINCKCKRTLTQLSLYTDIHPGVRPRGLTTKKETILFT